MHTYDCNPGRIHLHWLNTKYHIITTIFVLLNKQTLPTNEAEWVVILFLKAIESIVPALMLILSIMRRDLNYQFWDNLCQLAADWRLWDLDEWQSCRGGTSIHLTSEGSNIWPELQRMELACCRGGLPDLAHSISSPRKCLKRKINYQHLIWFKYTACKWIGNWDIKTVTDRNVRILDKTGFSTVIWWCEMTKFPFGKTKIIFEGCYAED